MRAMTCPSHALRQRVAVRQVALERPEPRPVADELRLYPRRLQDQPGRVSPLLVCRCLAKMKMKIFSLSGEPGEPLLGQ